MSKNGVAKNFVFQFAYQALMMLLPLVLSPYLTRTLGGDALGRYSYVNSIAYYFYLFANLGIVKYGQRVISQNIGNDQAIKRSFWSLYIVHSFTSIVSILAFSILIILFAPEDKPIYILHYLYLLFALFDISWFYYGLEEFRSVVLKNAVVKIVECILIFTFIKTAEDLWLYALIVNGGYLLGALLLWPHILRDNCLVSIKKEDVIPHIKPLVTFSVATIAVSMYTIFDKTLLGLMTNKDNVAFYEYSYKINMIPIVISSVIGTVMFPRACRLASIGDTEGQKRYFSFSVLLSTALSMGSIFGLLAVGDLLAVEYYGTEFQICGRIMCSLAPMIYIGSIGDLIRTQYLIPAGKDKEYVKCTFFNAIINIIVSIALIPSFGIYGAVIGTTSAEIFGLFYQAAKCRYLIDYRLIFIPIIPFSLIGLVMAIGIRLLGLFIPETLAGLILRVTFGILVFCLLSLTYLVISKNPLYLHLRERLEHRKRKD